MAKPPKRTGPRPSDVQRRTRELVTPEGVTLHLRLASAGSRAGAFTIDAVIMLATLIALTIGAVLLLGSTQQASAPVMIWPQLKTSPLIKVVMMPTGSTS